MEYGGNAKPCNIDVFYLYVSLFVLVCGGYAGETLYPRENAVSTGAF